MKLVLKNFRNHASFTHEFDKVTTLSGTNGSGKTSILEAIVFALYGRDYFGSIGTDRYIKSGEKESVVALTIGKDTVKRVLTAKGAEIYLNDEKVSQSQVDVKFGVLSQTLPGINPTHFMYMDDKNKRKLFMGLLPSVDRSAIFKKKYGDELLQRFELSSEKQVKVQLKSAKESMKAAELMIGQLREQLRSDEAEKGRLEKQVVKGDEPELSAADFQKELAEKKAVLARYGNLKEIKEGLHKDLEALIANVKTKLEGYGGATLSAAIESHTALRDKLHAKHKEVDTLLIRKNTELELFENGVATGVCGTCGQDVDAEYSEKHIAEHRQEIEKYNGMSGKLAEQYDIENGIVNELEELQAKGAKIQGELEDVNGMYAGYEDAIEAVQKMEVRESLYVNDEAALNNRELKGRISVIADRIKGATDRIAHYETQIDDLEPQLKDLAILSEALGAKGVQSEVIKEQTKVLKKAIAKYMPKVSIETTKENKTNEGVKEVFNIFIDGVEFKSMSAGERMKLSIAFALAVQELQPTWSLPFILLDEATILSSLPMKAIERWCSKAKVTLIKTRVSNTKFNCGIAQYAK